MRGHMLLVALLLTAGTAPAQPAPTTLDVVLADFSFTPSDISLHHGQPYVLHLTNQGSGGHNFSGQSFFAAVTLDEKSKASIRNGKVEVPKGTSVDIGFTPVTPGSYPIKCTHFLHSGFGMKGTITIH